MTVPNSVQQVLARLNIDAQLPEQSLSYQLTTLLKGLFGLNTGWFSQGNLMGLERCRRIEELAMSMTP